MTVKELYPPVPATLLTGFLGSGKTTLLNDLLVNPRMRNTAVIVNEFGTIPVDHDLVQAGSERYFRTTTGCICCTATSDIRASLFELHGAFDRGEFPVVSRVLIETTGLADPAPIINSLVPGGAPAMGLRDHVVARHFYLSNVITTFDVIAGREALGSFIEGWKQLAFADHIILTKTDIAEERLPWTDELRRLSPTARFHDKQAPDFRFDDLISTQAYSIQDKAEDVQGWLAMEGLVRHDDHLHDPNRHGSEIEALSLVHDQPLDPRAVITFLELVTSNISSGLLRLKGIFATTDDPERPVIAHAVQHRLYPLHRLDRWPGEDRQSRIVLIGRNMPHEEIRKLFEVLIPRKHEREQS
ncbi:MULTISPECIES: GTP-binding protein [unclassified Sinorhizobium]|uniref:CobW family GTP-binding protein n=1 Tax=unclassified Sinorhizobium TaxID=2613772 RepID=UPI0024C30DF7|nr:MULTISPECIES: GTP-binding protein [unclassified Sinorhizobium]MDK1376469.1 GTP-binding protein [Sinorhizobium sp. 6-70]MDK1480983.1 GTP-binding protein [Sinorhizobium sp. 6-117]